MDNAKQDEPSERHAIEWEELNSIDLLKIREHYCSMLLLCDNTASQDDVVRSAMIIQNILDTRFIADVNEKLA
jgi:hypothetical protein